VTLKAPFPWFGGKSRVAADVWPRFGAVSNYLEPFAGSLAVLLAAPKEERTETVNDKDGFVCNFYRSVAAAPDEVAAYADQPIFESDLHARHAWLLSERETLTARLEGNPDYFDAKIAGVWLWGISTWIGSGWCSGTGSWVQENGLLVQTGRGRGISRQLPAIGVTGGGIHKTGLRGGIADYMRALRDRLRYVRVCCGDWSRILGPSVTYNLNGGNNCLTGIFLDPPYSEDADRHDGLYAVDDHSIAGRVREWAIANGSNPLLRIALCGYAGEHSMPGDWECLQWKANGGYGSQAANQARENAAKERIWFSPHCVKPEPDLFSLAAERECALLA
jgi:hypothetical protein